MLIIKCSLKEEIIEHFSKEIIGHFSKEIIEYFPKGIIEHIKNNMYFRIHDKEISYYTSQFYRHI